jgi:hypothetical protein
MSKLSQHFPEITLSGYSASDFWTLFRTAKEFLDIHPDCKVQFEFNGKMIQVNDTNEYDAWDTYTKGRLFQER